MKFRQPQDIKNILFDQAKYPPNIQNHPMDNAGPVSGSSYPLSEN